jgi:hypothetical protein
MLSVFSGCSGNKISRQVAAMNTSNIQRVSNLYTAFQHARNGSGPKDEDEFKTFIAEFDVNKLAMMGVDPGNLVALFTSERDGKPFEIRYSVGGGRGAVDAVVFEQVGLAGKHQVGYTGGKVEEVANGDPQVAGPTPAPSPGPPAARPAVARPEGAPTGPPGGVAGQRQ